MSRDANALDVGALADALPGCGWVAQPDGRVVALNAEARALLGVAADRVLREGWAACTHPEDRPAAERAWRAALHDAAPFAAEHRVRNGPDGWRPVLRRAAPLRAAGDDAPRAWLGTCTDLRAQRDLAARLRRAELERERAEARLAASDPHAAEARLAAFQRLESLGRLAGGIAHDLNNILVPVFGYLDLHLAELREGTRLHDDLARVRRAAERAGELTRRILAFSRQQVLRVDDVDLNAVVREAAALLGRLLGERITLELDLAPETLLARADAHQISQVVTELAVNARDAMPDGGTLRLVTRRVQLDEHAARHTGEGLPPGEWALLRVEDDGHGMPPEVAERAFDPFFTTKRPGQASGLGLSTAFGIVEQHGGALELSSERSRGTVCRLHLPAVRRPRARPAEAQRLPDAPARRAPRGAAVLVTEDDPVVRRLVCEALAGEGHTVLGAASAEEALERVGELAAGPALLLTDVILPGRGGRELFDALRERFAGLRVIYMTGYAGDDLARFGGTPTAPSLLNKPFTVRQLLRAVQDALAAPTPAPDPRPEREG